MSEASFAEIGERIMAAKRIAVVSHVRPDGDAIGSSIALASVLRETGKNAVVSNESGLPSNLRFLPESETVLTPGEIPSDQDLVIALDTSNRDRVGQNTIEKLGGVAEWINIDHHISNERYGSLVHVDSAAPATGQIVYDLIDALDWPLTPAARDNLYVAISTDTGSFQYPSTTAHTYEIAAALTKAGADVGTLNSKTYDSFPLRRIEILRELLNSLQLNSGDACASWTLTMEMKERLGVHPEDTENLINLLRGIDTVLVAAFFEQLRDGTVRVSLRSKSPEANVSEICAHFGGGGHRLAAGAKIEGEFAEIQANVLKKIDETLKAIQS